MKNTWAGSQNQSHIKGMKGGEVAQVQMPADLGCRARPQSTTSLYQGLTFDESC